MNSTEMLFTDIKERIGYIVLNRIEKKNALNYEFISLFKSTLKDFSTDDSVTVVVIKSNSDVFCAGADLEYLISLEKNNFEDNVNDTRHIAELFQMIYEFPKIVIAQVEGHAIAGGCGIATAADFCFATPYAKFGYSEVKIGFIPALVSVYLIKKIGETKARDLLLTGKLVSNEDVVNFGLANKIIDADKMEDEVFNFANKLAETTSLESINHTKSLLTKLYGKSWEESLELAIEANARMRETKDFRKGLNSFIHKEKLNW